MAQQPQQPLKVVRCPQDDLSFTNGAIISSLNSGLKDMKYVLINGRYVLKVFVYEGRGISANDIAFNGKQREWIGTDLGMTVNVKPCRVGQYIASMSVELEFYGEHQPKEALPVMDTEKLLESFHITFAPGSTTNVFSVGQLLTLQFKNIEKCPLLEGRILDIQLMEDVRDPPIGIPVKYGRLAANSAIVFEKKENSSLQLKGRSTD